MLSKNRMAVPHTINAPISLRKAKIGSAAGRKRDQCVVAHHEGKREQQDVAKQKTVDRLPHDNRILPDIEEQQHHQLAGKEHASSPAS